MAVTQPNQNKGLEMLGAITARLDELATCPENQFDADHAVDAIEESIGGSLASTTRRAAINDFTIEDIDHLETVVNRFDQSPPAMNDNEDLELFTDLIAEARLLIETRREQIAMEQKVGGRSARINIEMADARKRQQHLFIDTAQNPLNAAGDLDRIRTKRA